MKRIITLIIFLFFVEQQFIDMVVQRCRQMQCLGNLPHRTMGGLFWCHQLEPHRADLASYYAAAWLDAVLAERFAEGARVPIVPLLICREAISHPKDRHLQEMRGMIMQKLQEEIIHSEAKKKKSEGEIQI